MKKIMLFFVLAISVLPLNAIAQNIEVNASQVQPRTDVLQVTYQGGNPDKQLVNVGDVYPDSEYVGANKENFIGWENARGAKIGEVAKAEDATLGTDVVPFYPVFKQDPTPEPTPVVTYNIDITNAANIIVKASEVNDQLASNLITWGQVSATQTKMVDGVAQETKPADVKIEGIVKPEILNQVQDVKIVATAEDNTTKEATMGVLVVADDTNVSQDRSACINVTNKELTLTQSEAKELKDASNFISIQGVSAMDAAGKPLTVAMPQQQAINDIASGKVGNYDVSYGIASEKAATKENRNVFLATAKINVVADPEGETPVEDTVVSGTVDESQLRSETGNLVVQTSTSEGSKGVATSASTNVIVLVAIVFAASICLFVRRNK